MSESLQPGSLFAGRYEVERELGRGGMATVYLARDPRHGRHVAIKLLAPELSRVIGADRFQREIAITASLSHPHILPLHDSGEAEGQVFYVMPYVAGESLRARLDREHQLPLRDAVCIARGIAQALEHAHAHGVVHRDIKPENVLLADGQPVVADFGIARALESGGTDRLTATGMSIGTPAYMSPEQATGMQVDARSDLYSLGCVLYEMLAGEAPFTGATPQAVIARRMAGPVPDVRVVRDRVPPELVHVLDTSLAQVPADRYGSAREMIAALDAAEIACTPGVRTGSGSVRAMPFARKRAGLAAAIAILALGALGAWGYFNRGADGVLAAATDIRRIAVLPLANASGNMQEDFVASGLTDALIDALASIDSLDVISRTSVMQYAMMPMKKPSETIARELGADAVLEASVSRQGDRLVVSAQLFRAVAGPPLLRDTFERPMTDVAGLQGAVATSVASAIGRPRPVRFGGAAPARAVAPASQEAQLKGTYYAGQWRLREAITAFEAAIAVDSANAAAHTGLARAHYFLAFFGEKAPAESFSRMRRAADAALRHDPNSAEAHGLLAYVDMYDWNWKGAEEHFRKALTLAPANAQVHHDRAHYLLALGRQEESKLETARALALDPANPMLTSCVGWHSLFDDSFEQAAEYARESQRMMPGFWGQVVLGWSFVGRSQHDSAVAALRDATKLSKNLPFARAALAHALARSGQASEARSILKELLAESLRGYVSAYDIAVVYAGLRENASAIEWLRKAIGERSVFVVHLAWDARLDPLRGDPAFDALVAELGIPPGHRPRVVAGRWQAPGHRLPRLRAL